MTRLQQQLKDLPPSQSTPDNSSFEKGEVPLEGKVSSDASGGEQKQLTPQQKLEKEIDTLTKLLTDPPFINGNAETTVRQFESVVSQVKT